MMKRADWQFGGLLVIIASIGAWQYYAQVSEKVAFVTVSKVFDGFKMKEELSLKYQQVADARKMELDSLRMVLGMHNQGSESGARMANEYARRAEQYEELNQALLESYDKQILERLNIYMKEYCEEKGYAFVYGANGSGSLIYAEPEFDITSEMIEYVNQKYEGGE